MNMHSIEQPNAADPQLPLPVGSTPESSSKRRRKRAKKSLKVPLAEKIVTGELITETEVRPNEVRLIWDREAPAKIQAEPEKPAEKSVERSHKPTKKSPSENKPVAKSKQPRPEQLPAQTVETIKEPPKVTRPVQNLEEPTSAPQPSEAQERFNPDDFVSMPEIAPPLKDKAPDMQPAHVDTADISPVPPPVLPPEATSYRHFFWNEPTLTSPAAAMAEHSMLPAIDQRPIERTPARHPYVEAETARSTEQASASAEVTPVAPPLEAVPLHAVNEPQFPDRMPSAERRHIGKATNQVPEQMPQPTAQQELQPQSTLGLPELMKLSKKITIDGVKLSEVFAAKRIDEAGLRTVVQEYLRGGDVRRTLTHEIIDHDKSFERDPKLRHNRRTQVRSAVAHASAKTIQKTYQLGKTSRKIGREATHALVDIASQTHRELQASGITIHWPSIIAIAVIYSLILILLLA